MPWPRAAHLQPAQESAQLTGTKRCVLSKQGESHSEMVALETDLFSFYTLSLRWQLGQQDSL